MTSTGGKPVLTIYMLIMLSVALNTTAQVMLKIGMQRIGYFDFTLPILWETGWKVAFSPPILFGLFCYVCSVCSWLMVLSRTDISLAYPLSSIGFVVIATAGWVIFGETITFFRVLGIGFIILGVFFISRTA